ncbi:MAG TPA: hypothetical protein VLZ30_07125, partial [Verrucomicrobiae bacterium]|nr:hypothetical protein [Verrucomicrobiae bacterium]
MSAACTCGCCEGVEQVTPLPIANRPGLPALSYRVGTHATFLETMVARLSSNDFPALAALRTRDPGDPAIALLDSWAVVADVLTFYQERIANEGYLRTATERESILELARLIGYKLRPGVSASVYLAYTLDEDRSKTPPLPTAVTIPAGSRSQSVPGPGESPQSFETSADLDARSEWNNLQVRLTKPQTENTVMNGARNDPDPGVPRVYLQGVTTNLKPNDPLLIDFGDGTTPTPFRVLEVKPDAAANRTRVNLQAWPSAAMQQPPAQSIRKILAKQRDAIKSSGLTKLTIVKKVAKSLSDLQIQVDSGQRQDALAKYIQSITLPSLAKVLPTAQTHPRKRTLVPLLNNLTQQLTAAIESLSSVVPEPVAPSSAPSDRVFQTPKLLAPLLKQSTSLPPASSAELPRDTKSAFAGNAETNLQLLRGFEPKLEGTLSDALANAKVTPDSGIKVYALRVKASPFGSNAPKKVLQIDKDTGEILEVGEWPIVEWEIEPTSGLRTGPITFELGGPIAHEQSHILYLDANYEKITAGTVWNPSWVLIDQSAWIPSQRQSPQPEVTAMSNQPVIAQIEQVQTDIARADYGISGKTTRIQLSVPWLNIHEDVDNLAGSSSTSLENLQTILQLVYDLDFAILRNTAVYAQSEELPLAEEPIFDPVCDGHNPNHRIELDGLYDGLQSGRWLIVSGERVDIPGTTGVQASELMMLAGVEYKVSRIKAPAQPSQDQTAVASPPSPKMIDLPGDRIHTFLTLSDKLLYCYKRDTLTIYGNVVEATNGEMRNEALGNGDASQTLQQFTLKQSPLTFVSAPNTAGVDSTLVVRVNDVEWHEQDSLADLGPQDRAFITTTDDNDQTTVIFGNGVEGARLPTGTGNVKATYRNGIGAAGNVKVGQISLL